MSSSTNKHLHQAGNNIHGYFQNHGVQLTGNSINVNGNFSINAPAGIKIDPEKECHRALLANKFSDPIDDRADILSLKPRMIPEACNWIITNSKYKQWRNIRTRSQLLWVSGGQARGKTMLSIFLTQEFDRLAHQHGEITVLYYFIDRQDQRDTAVHVLRGLIARLVAVRKALIQHLIEEYEVQSDIFGPNSVQTLWRVFEAMVRDPLAGQVYCVLDGLDACTEDSLRRLIGRIRDFFLDEPQTVVDEGPYDESYGYGQSGPPRSAKPRTKGGAGLKMMLVSREEPEWLKDHLKDFPRIPIPGGGSKKTDPGGSSAKPVKKAPKLADIARNIVRKQTLENVQKQDAALAGPSSAPPVLNHHPASTQVVSAASTPYAPDQHVLTSGAISLSSGTYPPHDQPPAYDAQGRPSSALTTTSTVQSGTQTPGAAVYLQPTLPSLPAPETHQVQSSSSQSTLMHPTNTPTSDYPGTSTSPLQAHSSDQTGQSIALPGVGTSAALPASQNPASNYPEDYKKPVPVPSVETPSSASILEGTVLTSEPAEYPEEKPPLVEEPLQEDQHEEYHEDADEDEDYNPSLTVYIKEKIDELANEKQYSTAIRTFLIAALEFRGDGTFLWVDFAIEELRKVHVDAMEVTAHSLPASLDEMYCAILLNIPPSLVDLVIGLLRWTVCALRPLDLLELTVALNLSHYSPNDAMAFILNAVTACGSMIKVGDEDLTVNLVHNSIVELLTGESSPLLLDPHLARFHIRPEQIDGDIATFCISYLESGPFNETYICESENKDHYYAHIQKFPFVPYATWYWAEHLRSAVNPRLNMASPFWTTKSKSRKNWWTTYYAARIGKGTFLSPSNFNLLHLAAYLNLVPLAQAVVQTGQLQARLNKRDSHGMAPIDYAVAHGHIPMFLFLVQHNAKQQPVGESIFELACRKNQREMVDLLLNMGWNVNLRAQQTGYGTSLYQTVRYLPGMWHEGLDLNRDAWHMVFRDRGAGETPLHGVATYGHTSVMELLLDRGADVNAGTTKGFTPLMSAAYTGQDECLELLVKRGANIWAVTTENWLAMHYAAMRGKANIIEYFVDKGVPVDAVTVKNKSCLHLAAWAGFVEPVEYLVGKGANLELKSYKGETPLHLATRHTKPWMVELLLSFGADPNAVNNEGVSPIQWAQASTINAAKECLRILTTYGMEGYVPWQPPQPVNGANVATAAPVQIPQATGQSTYADPAARRASTASAPPTSNFPQAQAPRAGTFQGFEAHANITVQINPPQQNPYDPNTGQPVQPHGPFTPPQPDLNRTQSAPAPGGSKFSYDSNANVQTFGSMSPPSGPPPPYTAAAGNSPPMTYAEKSPAWTAQMNQTAVQQTPPVQVSPPMGNLPAFQSGPPTQTWNQTANQVPQQQQNGPVTPVAQTTSSASPPQGTTPQPTQGGLVGMLSSMAISSVPSRAPTPQVPQLPTSASPMPTPAPQQNQQPTPQNQQYQMPQTPQAQVVSPAPLMSPFQPSVTPAVVNSPYQSPATPAPQFQQPQFQQPQLQQPQLQQPFVSPTQQQPAQQFVQQPGPQPLQYNNHGLTPLNTTPSPIPTPYVTPPMQPQPTPQQPMNQFLTAQMTPSPYGQPVQQQMQPMQPMQPTPVQTPQYNGNSTASTYNSGYNYSAPPVNIPYNPNMGQLAVPMQQPGGWQVPPNNGMMFSPPPPSPVGKKKSFLGGLITKN